ncbi:hypothetical protein M0805_008005 [Coniferiporia weirii]|nr:hypothetical protein M0805_008005 [Coniferiporia weirii]
MAIGPSDVFLLMLVIEGVLLGVFTMFFAATMYILASRRRGTQPLNKPVAAVSISLYVVAFAHLCLNARRAFIAFIEQRDGSPIAFLSHSSDGNYVAKESLYVVQTTIGDGFLIYRLYIVWARDKRLLVFSSVFLLASIVSGIGALINAARATATTPIFVAQIENWVVSFFVLTLFTNFFCTALIALKIWWSERQLTKFAHFSSSFKPVMVIVIESGAIYSAALIALLGTYISRTWAFYFILDSMPHIIGIVFSLIIVRMSLKISSGETSPRDLSKWRARAASETTQGGRNLTMQSLVVQIQKNSSTRDDSGRSIARVSTENSVPSTLGVGSVGEKRLESIDYDS